MQLALKVAKPLKIEDARSADAAAERWKQLLKAKLYKDLAFEATVLYAAGEGNGDGGAIRCYEFGEVVLCTEGVGKSSAVEMLPCLLTEYAAAGSIADLMMQPRYRAGMPAKDARFLLRQIVTGLTNFHAKTNAIHRDLKPANIMLFGDPKDPIVKMKAMLGDVGSAKILQRIGDLAYTVDKGTPAFRPPEAESTTGHAGFDQRFDSWCLACTYLDMRFGSRPFKYLKEWRDSGKITEEEFKERWAKRSLELNNPGSPYGEEGALAADEKQFLQLCLDVNPLERPFAERLLDFSTYVRDQVDHGRGHP